VDEKLEKVAQLLAQSDHAIALTGAGISVDSGIPDFRSPGGLWDRFDPLEYASIDSFQANPNKVWNMIKEMNEVISGARPNPGHLALAELEQIGVMKAVITQNIDNLHQDAGSQEVIEFHGNGRKLVCLQCGRKYDTEAYAEKNLASGVWPPVCEHDGQVLKPDVIFFGEAIPFEASTQAQQHAQKCDVILVIGTSAMVFPASGIPMLARQTGSTVVEVNKATTQLTGSVAEYSLLGSSSEVMPQLAARVRELRK